MKLIKLIPLIFMFFSINYLYASYIYNIYPKTSGVIKYEVYNRSDNNLKTSKNINEDDSIKLIFDNIINENLSLNIVMESKFALQHPTILLLDNNMKKITYKQFSDNSTNLNWIIPQNYIQEGTHNYHIVYATNNNNYNFAFYFKTIQITKVLKQPTIIEVSSVSSSYSNKNEGFVGDEFVFGAKLDNPLPDGYNMYISFMGVDNNGNNSGYYGTSYLMQKKNITTYYYKKIIQKIGQNRKYQICIKNSNNQEIDCKVGTYTVFKKPIKISNFSINKIDETNDYVNYGMKINLTGKPKVVKIETDSGGVYYLLKDNKLQKPDFFTYLDTNTYKTDWTIHFRIYKTDSIQNKWFKLIVQDYRAKNANDLVDSDIKYFTVNKKADYTFTIKPDSLSKRVPADFSFVITTNYEIDGLKVTTSKGEEKIRHREGIGTFGAIQIEPKSNTTWNVKYHVNSVYPFDAYENDITLNFYLLDSDNNVLAQKSLTVKAYKNQSDDLSKIINFLDKSSVLRELNLGDKNKKYHHLSRAEAAVILYEFLKLKSSNFKLPYDMELYYNPFSDIDKNTNYYKAVITLANYNGSDDISVLTKNYGVFNPLENVTRFQFVKMIIEGLNIPKTNDFSYIQNYDDFSKLGADAKIYYATAVKEGIIKGDNNKLLPYDKLTIFQALTILNRVLDRNINVNNNQFEIPLLDNEKIGNPLGVFPDVQDYDPVVNSIKIDDIEEVQKEGNCTRLTVISILDDKAEEKDYYVWSANFGYFKKVSSNNKTVIFCPSTKEPTANFVIKVIGTDGYMNFDETTKILDKNEFEYVKNIGDEYPNELNFNIDLFLDKGILKENELFNINMKGSLYKDGLKIGLEKVAVELMANDKVYYINNVKWDNNSIYFIVPSIKELYGKNIKMRVIYGTNYKSNFKDFDVNYKPLYIISGQVSPDENGNYPKEVKINNNIINIDNGKFTYIAPNKGEYTISINKNYQDLILDLTDQNPTANIFLSLKNLNDYNLINKGVEENNSNDINNDEELTENNYEVKAQDNDNNIITERKIVELYIALFQRAPTKDEIDYWYNSAVKNNMDVIELANTMVNAAKDSTIEYHLEDLYPQYANYNPSDPDSIQELIASVYTTIFNRDAWGDMEGLNYWTNEVLNGKSIGEVIVAIENAAKDIAEDPNKYKNRFTPELLQESIKGFNVFQAKIKKAFAIAQKVKHKEPTLENLEYMKSLIEDLNNNNNILLERD